MKKLFVVTLLLSCSPMFAMLAHGQRLLYATSLLMHPFSTKSPSSFYDSEIKLKTIDEKIVKQKQQQFFLKQYIERSKLLAGRGCALSVVPSVSCTLGMYYEVDPILYGAAGFAGALAMYLSSNAIDRIIFVARLQKVESDLHLLEHHKRAAEKERRIVP